jgi:hypothetical protein
MRFNFNIQNAAASNSPEAHIRESTRMACIAYGLRNLGHEVVLHSVSPHFISSSRWSFFKDMQGRPGPGIQVTSAENLADTVCDVSIKCSVGTKNDEKFLRQSRLVVAHENHPAFDDDPRMLGVPFLIHDRVIEGFIENALFSDYLEDNITAIRNNFSSVICDKWLGYCGARWKHRLDLLRSAPDWCNWKIYDSHVMSGYEHAKWLCRHRGALVLRGDTPKVNLHPLAVLLGRVVVSDTINDQMTPNLCCLNSVLISGQEHDAWWEHVSGCLEDEDMCTEMVEDADEAYVSGWSPTGQARLICQRLGI